MDFVFGASWLRVTVISVTLSGLVFTWTNERKSVERANRLHRTGNLPKAVAVYQNRIDSDSLRLGHRYNLGTSLLELGSARAEEELAFGVESNDNQVTKLALYNLGVSRLLRAVSAENVDSMIIHARASVQANRNTLRLSPDQTDAKWNLSMAQRLLDSIDAANRRAGRVTAEGPANPDELVPAENMLEGEEEDPSAAALIGIPAARPVTAPSLKNERRSTFFIFCTTSIVSNPTRLTLRYIAGKQVQCSADLMIDATR